MTRLFLTLYFGVISTLFGFLILLEVVAIHYLGDVEIEDTANTVAGYLHLLDAVEQHIPPTEMEQLMRETAAINQQILIPLDEFEPGLSQEEIDLLEKDRVLVNSDAEYVGLSLIDGSHYLIVPDEASSLVQRIELINGISTSSIFVVLALYLALWMYWLHRKLSNLERTAQSLANGDLSARAPTNGRQQVGSLNRSFNHMADRIQKLIESHKQLSNAVAHELRSPIFRLHCQLEMLTDSQDTSERQQFAQGMEEDLNELEALVNELLAYARFERADQELKLQSITLNDWLPKISEHLQIETDKPLLSTLPSTSLHVNLDSRLMERAVTNLIRNAIRHSRDKIEIILLQEEGQLVIRVEDDGPGIPEEDRLRIFQPFARLEAARDRASGGHGLGLAIAQQIVHLHQGQLTCHTSPLGGASMQISLPLDSTINA